jgi:hypothetical protein
LYFLRSFVALFLGGAVFIKGRSEKMPSEVEARASARKKRASKSRRGSTLMFLNEFDEKSTHQSIWCSGPNCADSPDERDVKITGVAWLHKKRLCYFWFVDPILCYLVSLFLCQQSTTLN